MDVNKKASVVAKATKLNVGKNIQGDTVFSIRSDFKLPTVREADAYYETLYQTIVSQKIIDNMGKLDTLANQFQKVEMINGIMEVFYQGLLEVEDFTKTTTIGDFNAEENDKYQLATRQTFKKRVKLSIPRESLIQAFSSSSRLANFVDNMILQIARTFDDLFMQHKTQIITDEKLIDPTSELITPVYDKYFNTTALKAAPDTYIPKLLENVKRVLMSLATPSNQHLAITNKRIKYSGGGDTFTILISSKNRALIAGWEAVTYNWEKLGITVKTQTIDFDLIEGVTKSESDKIDLIILSSGCLVQGFQVDNYSEIIKTPNMKSLMVLNNWFGYASIPTKPKYMFKQVDAALKTKIDDYNLTVDADPNHPTEKLWQIEVIDLT